MHPNPLTDVLLLLAASVLAVTFFRRLNLPPILAYLGVGAIIGPHALGWVDDSENTRILAEFGVVFLLFTLGLEFSLTKLATMRRAVLGMGGAQVIITTLVAGGVAWGLGLSTPAALVVGGVLAMSSTAIVIKLLAEQLELNSRHGRAAVGILLFQDLAVIPFLILIPALASGSDEMAYDLGIAMLKGVLVTGLLLAAGRWLLRPMFNEIAKARSPELFTLTVLLVALASAALTQAAGLSMALGAFLAGIMLSETAFRHQIESDIRPFQDVLLGLFFITIGMLLDMQALPQFFLPALALLITLILMKALIIFGVGVGLRQEPGVALRTGLVLAQGGEFGFALLALASRGDLLTHDAVQIVLTAVLLSMVATPFLVRFNGRITKLLVRGYRQTYVEQREDIARQGNELEGHVIISGFGRVGQNLAYMLDQEDIPYIALEVDPDIIEKAQSAGYNVHFANATHMDLLTAAGIDKARALVITHHDAAAAIKTLNVVRMQYQDLPILVRAVSINRLDELIEAGATEVVPDAFEASLMLGAHLMTRMGIPMRRVLHRTQRIRHDNYSLLRHIFQGRGDSVDAANALRGALASITLPGGAWAVGRTLEEALAGLEVLPDAIRRGGIKGEMPEPDTMLQADDTLILYGSEKELERAETRLLGGH
ncbi:MAG: potassium transporter [Halothiobacillaceae bacterium]|nr:MAG: potassium transporter [Halothiobacillaceae bacterium]